MGAAKRELEALSERMGFGGEITDEVMVAGQDALDLAMNMAECRAEEKLMDEYEAAMATKQDFDAQDKAVRD